MKKKIFIVDHGTYPFDILVCIGVGDEEIYKQIEKTGYRLSEKERDFIRMEGEGRTVILEGGQTVLRLALKKDAIKFYATLAHEIFHAVDMLFKRINLKLDENSDEAFAYQIEYLTGSIYEKLK